MYAEIWDALRAAAGAEINLAQLIVDSAGIIVQSEDLSTCYDERGQLHTLQFLFAFFCNTIRVSRYSIVVQMASCNAELVQGLVD